MEGKGKAKSCRERGRERRRGREGRERGKRKRRWEENGVEAHGLEKPQVYQGSRSWGIEPSSGRSAQSRCVPCIHIK